MLNVAHGKEIVLHVRNDIGILGEVARLISERGVGIEAVSGNVDGEGDICVLRLITDDNLRACDILHEHGYHPIEEQVVLLEAPHKPGMLKKLTQRLGEEEIEIRSLYATASEKDPHCLMVLRTSNDARALVCLSEFVFDYV
jgi:hypothetical protein